MRALLVAVTCLVGLLAPAGPADAAPKASDLVQAELLAEPRSIEPGRPFTVGVRLKMAEHWHTYWRNPGDSGLATEIAWTLPPGFSAGPIQWPTPARIPVSHLVNYGYEDEATLLVEITPPAEMTPGRSVLLKAQVNYLVCERECIPGEAQVSTSVPTAAPGQGGGIDSSSGYLFEAARNALPGTFDGAAGIREEGGRLALRLEGGSLSPETVASAYFFPADETAIEHAAPQDLSADASGLSLALKRSAIATGPAPRELAGTLVLDEKGGTRRSLQIGSAPPTAAGAGAAATAAPAGIAPSTIEISAGAILTAALLAFLGGLILNLMPCVFPVLSIKVMSLVEHSGRSRALVRTAGLAYTAGVVASFLALAGLLLAARAGGQEIGWGFQLQSPAMVVALIFLLFAVGLSLSGVVEFGASLAGRAGSVEARSGGLTGSFLTGVLAAIVATPCTAPFMGVAIGYAVTAPVPVALTVFASLGLGLAAPFLVLTAWPSLLAFLPRPGAWMDTLKQVLAFPVYATVAWLLFVLAQQVGPGALFAALLGLVVLAFALWCWRLAAEREGMARAIAGTAGVLALAGLIGIGWVVAQDRSAPAAGALAAQAGQERFTQARLDQLRAEGRPVFINMTAAWCITCLVNERTVLGSGAVTTGLADRGIVYMKGDWTNQNPEITRLLETHGRNGVPLYVLYPARGAPVVLPQILTQASVLEAFNQVPLAQAPGTSRRADAATR